MNIKKFLKTFGITSKEFAKKIDISPVSLSRYINGERIPEKNIINKIYKESNGLVDANDFFLNKRNANDISLIDIEYVEKILKNIRNGSRRELAKAITLIESSLEKDKLLTSNLLSKIKEKKNCIRIGITGVPGVGKSTFIEAIGMYLIDKGFKVAVLAVDPSSKQSGGSILGDKTRMQSLSTNANAYVRPSPSQGHLGGVAKKTLQSIKCLEEYGFNVIFVETMGVGQAETAVYDMVDIFLVLLLPSGGDELQGIKKGIIELADLIIVNKADGLLEKQAELTRLEYKNASQISSKTRVDINPNILTCSSIKNQGITEIWNFIEKFIDQIKQNGNFEKVRNEQKIKSLWTDVSLRFSDYLEKKFKNKKKIKELVRKIENDQISSDEVGNIIYDYLTKKKFD